MSESALPLTKAHKSFFRAAKKAAYLSDYSTQLGAAVVCQHKVISTGHNSCTKCHNIQKQIDEKRFGCACSGKLHAETAALIPLIKKKVDLSKAVVYVSRTYKDGTEALAKPCQGCQSLLQSYGIKKVYYTTSGGYSVADI